MLLILKEASNECTLTSQAPTPSVLHTFILPTERQKEKEELQVRDSLNNIGSLVKRQSTASGVSDVETQNPVICQSDAGGLVINELGAASTDDGEKTKKKTAETRPRIAKKSLGVFIVWL